MAALNNKPELKTSIETSLSSYHTFGTNNSAARIFTFKKEAELCTMLEAAILEKQPYLLLGGGSNVLFASDFSGSIFVDCSDGISIESETLDVVKIRVASGVNWHKLVTYCVENNFGGIENLALIPGKAGAAPIQNIGAYGVELSDILESVSFFELPGFRKIELDAKDCKFKYRHSIFKEMEKGRFWISSILLRLRKNHHRLTYKYEALSAHFQTIGKTDISIIDIYQAVVEIRQSKLPDPEVIGNAGSFFKNPIISSFQFEQLRSKYAELPGWKLTENTVKIPAAWLIDDLGFKGIRIGDAGVHEKHALVLVNYGKATGGEVLRVAETIKAAVQSAFDITLEFEVNIIRD